MKVKLQQPTLRLITVAVLSATLSACGGDGNNKVDLSSFNATNLEPTPSSLSLAKVGGYSTNVFAEGGAEITSFDPASARAFVVNAKAGTVDVLNLVDPTKPAKVGEIKASALIAGGEINSVAVANGIVAAAIQAPVKTDPGVLALYRASDLALLSSVAIGAVPDNVTFSPDGKTVLVANEGEPSDDYQIDPEGSVSVVDVSDPAKPVARTAGFGAFNSQAAALKTKGVRIYGPNATVAKDLEPEYIAVTPDSKTAFVTLQENNALAKIDIATATVTDIIALGYKDYGRVGNEIDASDRDSKINIQAWPGVFGMYQPDTIAAYSVGGKTYLVTANEGDARAWGEDTSAYWSGDTTKGFVEEFRVKYVIDKKGWSGRAGDDLPPQLAAIAKGGLLNPEVFAYCGAKAGDPGKCRDDASLGRLNITWTQGYRTNAQGQPVLFNASGVEDPAGDRLMFDKLYSYGARSFTIWSDQGQLVWDSGSEIEKFLASDECKAGPTRTIACKDYFNQGHDEGNAFDSRSDAKGPEPEGLAVGQIGAKTFAFVGLERMGGVLVYDITNPAAPKRVDYLNTRTDWVLDPETNLSKVGDLGPEGLHFIAAKDSPNGRPLLLVGNEVSGSTAVIQLNLNY
jgi:DNA-binding beta-propeller fold protein YncE